MQKNSYSKHFKCFIESRYGVDCGHHENGNYSLVKRRFNRTFKMLFGAIVLLYFIKIQGGSSSINK